MDHASAPARLMETFHWATGIEDTFITAPWPATGRTLDEYELTGHYEQWREDLALMAELGVRTARYGIPWHRIQPAPKRWEWEWADRPLERLLELGINPIVDLVHYGLPGWIEGAYLHPDFAELMAEYAGRLAERFRGRIRWYTPLNEPRITAWYCGRLGWWPPFRRGWRGFVEVMLGVCRGIAATDRRLREIDPGMVLVHVHPADVYYSPDPELQEEADLRQQIGFLAHDLVCGQVDQRHPLYAWLIRRGARDRDLAGFAERAVQPDIIGLNCYPMFSRKRLRRTSQGLRLQSPYGSTEMVERLIDLYWEHCRLPLMITETAARGTPRRRQEWLDRSVEAVRRARSRGIPVIGYTWWPMFALVAWAYRQSERAIDRYLEQMGLWDLDRDPDGTLRRIRTPLVDAYRALVDGGTAAVGPLARARNCPEARAA